MPGTAQNNDLHIDDLTVEELSEVSGADGCLSTVGTVSTPASLSTAACIG
jgi:hypothetical protein